MKVFRFIKNVSLYIWEKIKNLVYAISIVSGAFSLFYIVGYFILVNSYRKDYLNTFHAIIGTGFAAILLIIFLAIVSFFIGIFIASVITKLKEIWKNS